MSWNNNGGGGSSSGGQLSPRSAERQHFDNFERSFSLAAPQMAEKIREKMKDGITNKPGSSALFMEPSMTCAPNTAIIPPLHEYSLSIQSYLFSKLLDVDRLEELQRTKALNYHPRQQKAFITSVNGQRSVKEIEMPKVPGPCFSALLPLRVMGDGNCCLHAISLALWGVQDRDKTLRTALEGMMTSKQIFFKQRWIEQEKQWDAEDARIIGDSSAIDRPEEEWKKEWDDLIVRCGKNGAFLTQIHLFVLVHVIRRPIVVFAHTVQDDYLCRFRGIYLPLEWPEEDCEKAPIFLAYQGSHFVPLTYCLSGWPPERHEDWPLVPIEIDDGGGLLPVLFSRGRPTRVSGNPTGLENVSDLRHVETRLPAERLDGNGPMAVRMDLKQACGEARRRLRQKDHSEVPDIVNASVSKMIKSFLEQGRKARSFGKLHKRPPLKSSDSDLARILQQEEWDSQVAISNGMRDLKLLSPASTSPGLDRSRDPQRVARFPSFGSVGSAGSAGGSASKATTVHAVPAHPRADLPARQMPATVNKSTDAHLGPRR